MEITERVPPNEGRDTLTFATQQKKCYIQVTDLIGDILTTALGRAIRISSAIYTHMIMLEAFSSKTDSQLCIDDISINPNQHETMLGLLMSRQTAKTLSSHARPRQSIFNPKNRAHPML
jgi:hypothetical protein